MNAIIETIEAMGTDDVETTCERVGLHAGALTEAAQFWWQATCSNLFEYLAESGTDDPVEVLRVYGAQVMAGFMQGAITGARMAQAGLAVPPETLT